MAPITDKVRPKWFWPLIAFLTGLFIGWWIIGWLIWPVKWNNAVPTDLRAAERDHYLQMVAESYAASANAELAQERLTAWSDQQLTDDLARLEARLAGANDQAAGQVQQLATALGVESGAPASSAGESTATEPNPTTAPGSSSILRTVCTAGLWVILVLAGLAAILWLWNRWRTAKGKSTFSFPVAGGPPAGARGRSVPSPTRSSHTSGADGPTAQLASSSGTPEPAQATTSLGGWEEVGPGAELSDTDLDASKAMAIEPARATVAPAKASTPAPAAVAPSPAKPAAPSSDSKGRAAQPPASSRAPVMAREFRAVYQMGEPDYDEAFDVADSSGAHLGQCGLELTEPVGRSHDQAAALQVWLWDTNDPDTKVKILMSEGAYRDTALRAQLAAEHQAIPVKEGTEFELESYKLMLKGAIEKIDYADQEPSNGIFAEIRVRLQVYQKGR